MSSRYRIITNGTLYRIQERIFFIWIDFTGSYYATRDEAEYMMNALMAYDSKRLVRKGPWNTIK